MLSNLEFYTNSEKVPDKYWSKSSEQVLKSKKYFSVIETILAKSGVHSFYVCTEDSNATPVLFQYHKYDISLWKILGGSQNPKNIFSRFISKILARPKLNIVICGNLLVSGESGVWLDSSSSHSEAGEIIFEVSRYLKNKFRWEIGLILYKDLTKQQSELFDYISQSKNSNDFKVIQMAALMVLNVNEKWTTLEDYFDDLKSKYRTQYQDVRHKAVPLIKKNLATNKLLESQSVINNLYSSIYNKANAKGPYLGADYFTALNNTLNSNQFNLVGYYNEDNLIAINSRFTDSRKVISSFFGVDEKSNEQYALFKNMLLDDLEYAIDNNLSSVNYGRTTYEIKSAIGAKPVLLNMAILPLNRISSGLLPIIRFMLKETSWHPRTPFRSNVLC